MKHIKLFLPFLLFSNIVYSQLDCGFKTPKESIYDNSIAKMVEYKKNISGRLLLESVKYIRVSIVDILNINGTDSSWTKQEINDEFQIAKDIFKQYNICLILVGVDYVNTSSEQNYDANNGPPLQSVSYNTSAINIYLHKILTLGPDPLNGFAYAFNSNKISLSRGAITNLSMAHEIGHSLGLLHTFETSYGLECPDGSNSSSTGDKITDTRATPDADSAISANTNMSCIYSGSLSIYCNGATRTYNPEIINLMSYGRRTCRSLFTPLQVSLMHSNILSQTDLIMCRVLLSTGLPLTNTIIVFDFVEIGDVPLQIGSNSNLINALFGFTAKQRFLNSVQIKLTAGTKIVPTSNRCKVIFKATPICNEIINYSF